MTLASALSVPLPIGGMEAILDGRVLSPAHREGRDSEDSDSAIDAPSINIDAFRQGDPQFCRRVLDEFSPLIWSVVVSYVREPAAREDVYQEICFRVWERRGLYSGRGSLAGWINRIAHRWCYNWCRRQKADESSRRRYGLKTVALHESVQSRENPGLFAARSEFRSRLGAALAALPTKQSDTFILVRVKGCTAKEAARVLGVRPATVRSNLRHATRRLRRELKEFEHGLS